MLKVSEDKTVFHINKTRRDAKVGHRGEWVICVEEKLLNGEILNSYDVGVSEECPDMFGNYDGTTYQEAFDDGTLRVVTKNNMMRGSLYHD